MQFLRIGDLIVNSAAIATVYDEGDAILITLLSTNAEIQGTVSEGNNCWIGASETVEICGDQATAVRNYFFSAAVSKKIV